MGGLERTGGWRYLVLSGSRAQLSSWGLGLRRAYRQLSFNDGQRGGDAMLHTTISVRIKALVEECGVVLMMMMMESRKQRGLEGQRGGWESLSEATTTTIVMTTGVVQRLEDWILS